MGSGTFPTTARAQCRLFAYAPFASKKGTEGIRLAQFPPHPFSAVWGDEEQRYSDPILTDPCFLVS